ncbi:MAG: hypothetical protein WCJ39_06285 [bacterium]
MRGKALLTNRKNSRKIIIMEKPLHHPNGNTIILISVKFFIMTRKARKIGRNNLFNPGISSPIISSNKK